MDEKDDVMTNEETEDTREEETKDEIRDEDYVNDDEIEMDRSIEKRLDSFEEKIMGKLDSIYDSISLFVDSGAVIREANPNDIAEAEDDFADEFLTIDDLDFSID